MSNLARAAILIAVLLVGFTVVAPTAAASPEGGGSISPKQIIDQAKCTLELDDCGPCPIVCWLELPI